MSRTIISAGLCLIALQLFGQTDPDSLSAVLESVTGEMEDRDAQANESQYDLLSGFLEYPVDLNSDDIAIFTELGLLTADHVFALKVHIRTNGPLLSVYELQSVPGFTLEVIRSLTPLVTLSGSNRNARLSMLRQAFLGDNKIYLRWGRTLELSKGYAARDSASPIYSGDPNRLYLRFQHRHENRLMYGATMEKDPGEEFFRGSNKRGFDFISGHFFLTDHRPWLSRLAIGDYTINLGQGLILHSGYGFGKGALVTAIKKGGPPVRPFASVNEAAFLRGAAVALKIGPRMHLTLFASSRKRDARITSDTLASVSGTHILESFTSLQLSGNHRTESEIADEQKVTHQLAGTSLRMDGKQGDININLVSQHLSSRIMPSQDLYQMYRFRGTSLFNASVDYTLLRRNIHVFGETAYSDNGTIATINGILAGIHRQADIAILVRWLPPRYHSLGASPFAETSSADNEFGAYLGIAFRPAHTWSVNAYCDLWKHPWLRFNADAPSSGQEQFVRITYRKKRSMELYLQYRHEQKERNLTGYSGSYNKLVDRDKHQIRLHFSYHLSTALEIRGRIEGLMFREHTLPRAYGFVLFQDILYKPVGSPFSFTTRIASFDTDSYDAAIYAYENDLISQFRVPAYAYRGVRWYINLRYRGIRDLVLELRVAQTRHTDRTYIGSGPDLIPGNIRTDMKAQIIWNF